MLYLGATFCITMYRLRVREVSKIINNIFRKKDRLSLIARLNMEAVTAIVYLSIVPFYFGT